MKSSFFLSKILQIEFSRLFTRKGWDQRILFPSSCLTHPCFPQSFTEQLLTPKLNQGLGIPMLFGSLAYAIWNGLSISKVTYEHPGHRTII